MIWPNLRRVRVRATALFAFGVLAATPGLAYEMWEANRGRGDDPWLAPLAMSLVILAALAFAVLRMPAGFRRQAEREVRRMYAEGANKSVLGAHELEIAGVQLISRSAYGEGRLRLRSSDPPQQTYVDQRSEERAVFGLLVGDEPELATGGRLPAAFDGAEYLPAEVGDRASGLGRLLN